MSAYLGTLGALFSVRCISALTSDREDRATFETTLEGRVKAQVRSIGRRSWSVDASGLTPDEASNLLALDGGEYGNGPFIWIPPAASVTNLLTPEVSMCGPQAVFSSAVSRSGPMVLADGTRTGASLTTTDPNGTLWIGASKAPVPVLPGRPVTASTFAIGAGAKARLHWYAADGSFMAGTVTSSGTGEAGKPKRLHATGVPPAGAISCTLSTTKALQVARPAVTWTASPYRWGVGELCQKALVVGLGRELRAAYGFPEGATHSNISFTITEVG